MTAAIEGIVDDGSKESGAGPGTFIFKAFAWTVVLFTFVYVISTYLTVWRGWPGIWNVGTEDAALAYVQWALYVGSIVAAIAYSKRHSHRRLRRDAMIMASIAHFIIRVAFWSVLLIGLVDAFISFLRVEGMLAGVFGEELAKELGRSSFRGMYVHIPLIAVALIISLVNRGPGFPWLALLVVVAELFIVLSRFVFSYEQVFQGDLVRFWYGSLFLFASAHTLFEDGHVRVDVLYAGFSDRIKGRVNAIGCVLLGMTLCWTVLMFGMWDKSSIVNTALLNWEVSQAGFGMFVKYWMAGFLAIFAISMSIQFSSYFLESIADHRGEPGKRSAVVTGAH